MIRLLQHEIHGTYVPFGKHIGNFPGECRKLVISGNRTVPEALRVIVPRALVLVYTMRNKRGIGHVGGGVDANRIDAATIARACDWVVCELIRRFHGLFLEETQDIVDGLTVRNVAEVWEVGGKKRVLKRGLGFKEKVLLLCYQGPDSAILAEDMFDWVEYSSQPVFKSEVLRPLHKDRLLEYDWETETITISPLGVKKVEESIL